MTRTAQRLIVAGLLLLVPSAGEAQERARVQVGIRAVGIAHSGEVVRAGAPDVDLGYGAGGELALGGVVGGWLVMELRAGYARLDVSQGASRRDLWTGIAARARLAPKWVITPVLGAAAVLHRLSFLDSIGVLGEAGLAARLGADVWLSLGVAIAPYLAERAPDLRLEAFVTLDVML